MSIDSFIVSHGAPSLCGIKPSCLFSMKDSQFFKEGRKIYSMNRELEKVNKRILALQRNCGSFLVLVYDFQLLSNVLCNEASRNYLESKGYNLNGSAAELFAELRRRLVLQKPFPHEVGLFLGYPLEDVIAFEKHGGRNSKCTGNWKVYGDVEAALKKMDSYRKCSSICMKLFENGTAISELEDSYRKAVGL